MQESGSVLVVSLEQVEIRPDDKINKVDLQPGGYVRLEVTDTGHGISKEIQDRIFEPYYTTKGEGDGTGLGLSVVHGIVKSYGGEITVYSVLGKGTTFQIYFKAFGEEIDVLAYPAEIDTPLPTGQERIMVVDDEKDIALLTSHNLESLGYTVSAYTNSNKALEAFNSQSEIFDLVITDMTMPKKNGIMLSKELLSMKSDIPIIICTGFSELIKEGDVEKFGIKKLIKKPILKKHLAYTVREVLDGRGNKRD